MSKHSVLTFVLAILGEAFVAVHAEAQQAPPPQVARSSVGAVGQRQSQTRADVQPMTRINSRVTSRIASRIRNRLDQNYDGSETAESLVEAANESLRRSGRSLRR